MTGVTQLVAPVVGYLSDRCTHPLGRRRPYMMGGAVIAVAGLAGMRLVLLLTTSYSRLATYYSTTYYLYYSLLTLYPTDPTSTF